MASPALDKITAQIQKLPNKTRYYGFGGFVLVLCGLFIYFFHIPMTTKIKQLDKEVAGLQQTIQANDAKIRKLDDLRAEVKSLEVKLHVLTEQLPPGSEVSGLLRQVQGLVNQSGLELKVWRPGRRHTNASGLYEEIPIQMDLTGGYHDFGIFLDRVSKLTRIVNVLNVRMNGATGNKAGGTDIRINCTANTFAAVEKKPDVPATAVKKSK